MAEVSLTLSIPLYDGPTGGPIRKLKNRDRLPKRLGMASDRPTGADEAEHAADTSARKFLKPRRRKWGLL